MVDFSRSCWLTMYGSTEINAFISNVSVSSTSSYEPLMELTNKILEEVQIYPKAYFVDGLGCTEESIIVVQTMSRMIFSTMENFDIFDKHYSKMYSCGAIFRNSIDEIPELKQQIIQNALVFTPKGRTYNLKFDPVVFSPVMGNKLLKEISRNCPTENDFNDMKDYFVPLFDAFKLIWDRKNMSELELERNSNSIINAVSELPIEIKLQNPEECEKRIFSFGRHKSIINSLRTISNILQQNPKLCFEAFTLFVEYFVLEIEYPYKKAFKKIIFEGYTVEDVNFWLGESNRKIVYHALICPHHLKQTFVEQLTKWK